MYHKYRHFLNAVFENYLAQMIPILYWQNCKHIVLRSCTLGMEYEFPVLFWLTEWFGIRIAVTCS
jgi:hypothetical protein